MRVAFSWGVAVGLLGAVPSMGLAAAHKERTIEKGAHEETLKQEKKWNGIWQSEAWADVDVSGRPVGGMAAVRAKSKLAAHPPYNAEWEATYQAALKTFDSAHAARTSKVCEFGYPGAFESPAPFELLVTPEQTLFLFATREARHVYTDGRQLRAPEDRWPTPMGESIGHWEGDALVVETIGRDASAPLRFSSPLVKLSEGAKFTERVRLVDDDRMEIEMVIEDPVALAKPWHLTLAYRRIRTLDRMIYHNCTENDRNPVVDGKLTITPAP